MNLRFPSLPPLRQPRNQIHHVHVLLLRHHPSLYRHTHLHSYLTEVLHLLHHSNLRRCCSLDCSSIIFATGFITCWLFSYLLSRGRRLCLYLLENPFHPHLCYSLSSNQDLSRVHLLHQYGLLPRYWTRHYTTLETNFCFSYHQVDLLLPPYLLLGLALLRLHRNLNLRLTPLRMSATLKCAREFILATDFHY